MASTLQVDGSITSSAEMTLTRSDNGINLSLVSTDADANEGPGFVLYRNSSSPADGDVLGQIYFQGENDADQKVTFAYQEARIVDASDGTEDGRIETNVILAGTAVSRILMDGTETVFNDNSKDLDFRVESDGNANMLFVDGGNNVVSIGGSPVETGDALNVIDTTANGVIARFVSDNDDAHGAKIILQKDSDSPADNDEISEIAFFGKDSNGSAEIYATMQVFADDVSAGTEDGIITFSAAIAGTYTELIRFGPTGVVINKNTAIANESGLGVFGIHNTDNNRSVLQMQCENAQSTGVYAQSAYYNGSALGTLEQHTGDGATDSGLIKWFTTPTGGSTTERMRITSGGTICIGTTSASGTSAMDIRQVNNQVIRSESTGSGSVVHVQFVKTSGGTAQIGDITGTTSSVSYNSGSDYRLKENVITDWDATTLLNKLKPSKFNFKDNVSETVTGFIAHEVQEVLPYLVSGEKDGENMQTMDYAKLTPLLTKAIQEQQEQIEQLKTEIKTLQ